MEDGLDVVAVGVEHERTVVPGVIARALARRAVVAVPGGERRKVESVDLLAAPGGEGDVHVLGDRRPRPCAIEKSPHSAIRFTSSCHASAIPSGASTVV